MNSNDNIVLSQNQVLSQLESSMSLPIKARPVKAVGFFVDNTDSGTFIEELNERPFGEESKKFENY